MQLSPSGPLSNIVKHYLLLESGEDVRANYRLFSDGNPGIVFQFKSPLIQYTSGDLTGRVQPDSFMYGQITHYNNLISGGKLGMLVVVLQPDSICALLHIAACELNNSIIKLADLFGQEAIDLEEQVLGKQNAFEAIRYIESFLLKKLAHTSKPDQFFKEALYLIYKYRGTLTIEELLKKIPVTERQLERKFKEQVGTSPKKFSDTIKLQHFLKLLRNHPRSEKISDVIYNCGYYDQSHLNNYFKKVTGVTPLQYKLKHRLLATNFMQLQGGYTNHNYL